MADRSPNQFDVFLSYHWRDHAQVEALAHRLGEEKLRVFLDRWYLTPGQSWPKALEATLSQCRSVAICVGQGEMGPWQQREQYLALERQVTTERRGQTFPVIPVLLPGAEPPLGFLSQNTWVDFRGHFDDPVLLTTLVNAISGQLPGRDLPDRVRETLATICPYRGLLYFREEDAPFFFGREAAITQLVRVVQQHNLVAVVGASGSGKSSVVRAGLVPALRKSHDPVWEIATLVPTDRPIHALAAVLMPLLEPDMSEVTRLRETSQLAEDLIGRKTSLRDVVGRVLAKQPGTERLLLIADQREELFTLCKDETARRCFIDNILEATANTKLSAVLTLRGDFFGRAITDYRPLSDRVQGAQVNLGPMNREELRLAIEEPAKQAGLTFEPGLVDLILEQMGDEPGYLPLVEFVLRQLWEQRRGGELHHEAYRAMGRLEGAIITKAESLYQALSAQDQQALKKLLLRLVSILESGELVRRRATIVDFDQGVRPLVKVLADERLVVTSRSAEDEEETLQLAHEQLIRSWDRLNDWINEEREFLIWRQRIELLAGEWERRIRDSELLLQGMMLVEAERWIAVQHDTISARLNQFVQASIARRQAALEGRVSFLGALRVFGLGAVQRELEQRMQTLAQGQEKIAQLQKEEEKLRRQRAMWDERVRRAETDLSKSFPNVFISYAKEDRQDAGRLFLALKDNGFQPWMDEAHILPGQDWQLSIQKAMEKADFLLICLSRHSLTKTGFVQREMRRAVELQQDLPEGQVKLIPVRLEDCNVPTSMKNWQWGNLYEPDGLTKVIQSMIAQWGKRNLSQSNYGVVDTSYHRR
ncbi:MAG TPA: TIR domain-containing protein [Nitrospira sp.]|nr:TIR domain-containing protein [Nitrospira sp.]